MQASFGNRRTRREVTLDLTDFRLEPEELERARAEWERPEACVPGTRDARSGSGCGCTSTQAPTGLALLFALLPWLRRRRAV